MPDTFHITEAQELRFTQLMFEGMGFRPEDAGYASRLLTRTNIRGIDSHGLARLSMYYAMVKNGKMINMTADLEVLRDSGSALLLDAHNGLGIIMAPRALELAAKRAKETGVCVCAVKNSGHYGAAGCYASMAAENGLACIIMSNTGPSMAPIGGRTRVLGNSPWSMALPGGNIHKDPVMFDIACSETSCGKCQNYVRAGKEIPDGWGVDETGSMTHDPLRLLRKGALLPFGGIKGYCITVLVEMMSILLADSGCGDVCGTSSYATDNPIPESLGHTFILIDPDKFCGMDAYRVALDSYFDNLKNAPKGENIAEIIVPGEIETRAISQRLTEGMEVHPSIAEDLVKTAISIGILSENATFNDLLSL